MNRSLYMTILIFLSVASMVFAMGGGGGGFQKTHTGIEGKVTDQNGKLLPGVEVAFTPVAGENAKDNSFNSGSGKVITTKTGSSGRYRFVALRPGYYRIKYSLEGHQTLEKVILLKRASTDPVFDVKLPNVGQSFTGGGGNQP